MVCVCLQGFLIESKLNTLLSPLERDEQSLMKLDAIFSVSQHSKIAPLTFKLVA